MPKHAKKNFTDFDSPTYINSVKRNKDTIQIADLHPVFHDKKI